MSRRHPNRLTQAEVADLLGFGRNKVAALTRNGHLPSLTDPDTGRPNCRDIATLRAGQQLKVCDRCLKRVESWRARNGLPALATLPARGAA